MNNIKIDLIEIEWNGMDWIDLTQDRDQWRAVVNMATKLRVPQNAWKFLSNFITGDISRRVQLHEIMEQVKLKRVMENNV
jgi:hypothetical protein